MRSHGESGRRWLERALRGAALGVVAVALWRGLTDREGARLPTTRSVAAGELPTLLGALPLGDDTLVVRVDTVLDARHRAWLAARGEAGAPVAWVNGDVAPLAVTTVPSRDPAGGVVAQVAAPENHALRLLDPAGFLDSARAGVAATSFALPRPAGPLAVRATDGRAGETAARVVAPAPRAPRAVVVLARAGWEGKFVLAALEERGWPVSARFVVRPDEAVTQGRIALDTARVAVVVALDETAAALASRIAPFVRRGGGLVLGPEAAAAPAFAALRAGVPGVRRPAELLAVSGDAPRRALALVPVSLRADAVALERRGGDVAVAARRVGAGRVVQVGYDDSWRWRMMGPEGAPEAHRRWWAAVVAAASPEGGLADSAAAVAGDAPLAGMVAALGAPHEGEVRSVREALPTERELPWWLGAVALGLLVGEWGARRLRGAR